MTSPHFFCSRLLGDCISLCPLVLGFPIYENCQERIMEDKETMAAGGVEEDEGQSLLNQKVFVVPCVLSFLDVHSLLRFSSTSKNHRGCLKEEMGRRETLVQQNAEEIHNLVGCQRCPPFVVPAKDFDTAKNLQKSSISLLGPLKESNPHFHPTFKQFFLLPRVFYTGNSTFSTTHLIPLPSQHDFAQMKCHVTTFWSARQLKRDFGCTYQDLLHSFRLHILQGEFEHYRLAARCKAYGEKNLNRCVHLATILQVMEKHLHDSEAEWLVFLNTIEEHCYDPDTEDVDGSYVFGATNPAVQPNQIAIRIMRRPPPPLVAVVAAEDAAGEINDGD